ncbi:MAG: ATP-binding protein [Aestuariibacter sp.]
MKPLSLKLRVFTAALLALLFFVPLMAFALKQAFVASLTQSVQERMELQALTLISEFEIVDGEHYMPEVMIHGAFNLPESGLYGVVLNLDDVLWRSMSAINWQWPEVISFPLPGNSAFIEVKDQQQDYFRYSYTAEFETQLGFTPVGFHVFQEKAGFNEEVEKFEQTLLYWLGIITSVLFLLLIFTLNTALRPISNLVRDIHKIESGNSSGLSDHYPKELETLKSSLNHLLQSEYRQRERYKNSLGDLAHSLKTPLAVLSGSPNLKAEDREPVEQINSIIQRQLKRAVAGAGSGWNQKEAILPIVEKLTQSMDKVYQDKCLSIEFDIDDNAFFYGDKTDFTEVLGNILDNACKAAVDKILISAHLSDSALVINVADDGPGIPENKKSWLLERGKRLDSYEAGQGIGMAVVADLVAAYQGTLEIGTSEWQGAAVKVAFPIPT